MERFRWVERNQPGRQERTRGQTEVIRCAGTRQDTAEGMAGRHRGVFHLLRSYVKDISSPPACVGVGVGVCLSIDVVYRCSVSRLSSVMFVF